MDNGKIIMLETSFQEVKEKGVAISDWGIDNTKKLAESFINTMIVSYDRIQL